MLWSEVLRSEVLPSDLCCHCVTLRESCVALALLSCAIVLLSVLIFRPVLCVSFVFLGRIIPSSLPIIHVPLFSLLIFVSPHSPLSSSVLSISTLRSLLLILFKPTFATSELSFPSLLSRVSLQPPTSLTQL